MTPVFFPRIRRAVLAGALILGPLSAAADPSHGIAMYGTPALPPDFVSLPYANPDAPKGGRIVFGNTGGFDSLNPFIQKGTPPWQLRFLSYEGLMGRSQDEPFTLYGLLAESILTADDRSWVEFTLREEARFWDGSPVTVDDVIWSFETLGTDGHLRYRGLWSLIQTIEQTGPRSVRLTFNEENRELALIAGLRPILKKAQWTEAEFTASGLDTVPIGTGAYIPGDREGGRFLELTRNPDYWGRDLPFRRGTMNLDTIRIEFFGDQTVLFEAFKAGELTAVREFNAEKWASAYDFPAITDGRVIKSEIPHRKPSGMTGFVMNTRKPPFDDWRVRAAMIHAYNFEFINDAMTGGAQPRITSYFSNSDLAMRPGPAEGRVRDLLEPFADSLLPGALEGYVLPRSDGSERNRANLRRAVKLLNDAGWSVQDGVLRNSAGDPFEVDILLRQGAGDYQTMINIYTQALQRLGITLRQSVVDDAQYNERIAALDFDMTDFRRDLSLSPGNEQRLYWGSDSANVEGTRNLMGVSSPAIDALIDGMLNATEGDAFTAHVRALDRVLTAGRYVIPIWQYNVGRIAHSADLRFPETLPIYGDGAEWMPHVWWVEPR
jgi:peptide/nickel transport system substrate-binding protein